MSFVLIVVVVVVIVLYFIDFCIHNSKEGRIIDKIPGPKTLPVIGNTLDFLYGPVPMFYQLRTYANRYTSIYRVWFGNYRIVNIYTPGDVEIVLTNTKNISKSPIYDFLHPWLKEGLLTSTGEKWKKRRKILTPAFHFNILKQHCKTFGEQSAQLVEKLQSEVGKEETDIIPFVTQFALQSISETAMGANLSSNDNEMNKYKKAVHEIGHYILYRLLRIWLVPDIIFALTSVGIKQSKVLNILHSFSKTVLDRRRESCIANGDSFTINDDQSSDEDNVKKKRMSMLDLLLQAALEGKIDDNGIQEEVHTFMFGGHDTTTMTTTFCLLLLANNMDAQDKVVAELDEIFKDSTDPASIDDLHKMKYLERCIKETLRLFPIAPFIARQLIEEVQLKDYLVPAGSIIQIHIFDMQRDASIFPAPDVFDPDRFTLENSSKRHPFAYIPFSAGPRNCIGQKFAMLELKSVISAILRKFILEPITKSNEIVFSGDLVLRTKDPVKVKFTHRHPTNL